MSTYGGTGFQPVRRGLKARATIAEGSVALS